MGPLLRTLPSDLWEDSDRDMESDGDVYNDGEMVSAQLDTDNVYANFMLSAHP